MIVHCVLGGSSMFRGGPLTPDFRCEGLWLRLSPSLSWSVAEQLPLTCNAFPEHSLDSASSNLTVMLQWP